MYMGFFGASADADNDWPNYLQSMVDQAREDFGKLGRGRVTKLCAYASSDADERFAEAVRGINLRTYEKHGEKWDHLVMLVEQPDSTFVMMWNLRHLRIVTYAKL